MQLETLETRNLMSASAFTLQMPEPSILIDPAVVMNVAAQPQQAALGMTAAQKHVAEQLTSAFENSTTTIQYDYIENINDGRGLTAGRSGFCTATGDFYLVVKNYTQANPGNALAKFLPRLSQLNDAFEASWSDEDAEAAGYASAEDAADAAASTSGLGGIQAAWHTASQDPAFRAAQDSVSDELYYNPAMKHAQQLGLTLAISKGQLWDAIIQNGDGDDHDGLQAMIDRTNTMSHGSPATGVSETAWLRNFLTVRKTTLSNATDADTREAWADSVSRVDAYSTLLSQGNTGLTGEIRFSVYGDDFVIPAASVSTPPPAPTPLGSISGRVFADGDEDGIENGSNLGQSDRVVFIDVNKNNVLDAGEINTRTDSNGDYHFSGLQAGNYNVRLQSVSWMFSTTPISQQVAVAAGHDTSDVLFGEWVTYRRH